MTFEELLSAIQAQAISNKLVPTEESLYRKICRSYSKKFHVPLYQIETLDMEHVILNVYEDNLDDVNVEDKLPDLLEIVNSIEDPDYEAKKSKEQDDFVKQIEAEEEERLKLGKPIHPSMRGEASLGNSVLEKSQEKTKEQPTSGFIDLSYLDDKNNT